MSEYTPTTEQVRNFWASDGTHQPAAKSYDFTESRDEFDRWLARVRRDAAKAAWDEACEAFAWCRDNGPIEDALPYVVEHNPYMPEETP